MPSVVIHLTMAEFDDSDIALPILELGLLDKIEKGFPEIQDISLNDFDIPKAGG